MAAKVSFDSSVFDLLPVGICAVDEHWKIIAWNKTIAAWTGINPESALDQKVQDLIPHFKDPRYFLRLEGLLHGGPPVVFSYQLHGNLFPDLRGKSRKRVRHTTASSLGSGPGILFTVEDRTEVASLVHEVREELSRRLLVEEKLRASVKVKETLLRELNHRVKNNLSMIVSFIHLDGQRVRDESSRSLLADLEARVESMALIYDLLYKGTIGDTVDLSEYLQRLFDVITQAFIIDKEMIQADTSLEPIECDIGKALHIGIIVSEILTNSLKYARRPGSPLALTLRLKRDEEHGAVELLAADNGPGFREAEIEKRSSMGWMLMRMLAEDLGGGISLLPGTGAAILLKIPSKNLDTRLVERARQQE